MQLQLVTLNSKVFPMDLLFSRPCSLLVSVKKHSEMVFPPPPLCWCVFFLWSEIHQHLAGFFGLFLGFCLSLVLFWFLLGFCFLFVCPGQVVFFVVARDCVEFTGSLSCFF